MPFHMWQMQQEFCTTEQCLRNMAGNSETWNEFIALCEQIQSEGIQPLYFGFKDTWTCLAPWNAIAVDLAPADVCSQVNKGETTFSNEYREVAEKTQALLAVWTERSICL